MTASKIKLGLMRLAHVRRAVPHARKANADHVVPILYRSMES